MLAGEHFLVVLTKNTTLRLLNIYLSPSRTATPKRLYTRESLGSLVISSCLVVANTPSDSLSPVRRAADKAHLLMLELKPFNLFQLS